MDNKIKLNTLGLPRVEDVTVTLENGVSLTVAPRLPYEVVFEAIEWCINRIIDDRSFVSAPLQKVITDFAILKYYTDLDCNFLETFSVTQEIYENYDIICGANVIDLITPVIDAKQLAFFHNTLQASLNSIIAYKNSAKGIVDVLTENAETNTEAMEKALTFINDPEKREEMNKILNFYAEDATAGLTNQA